jgi:hypothetical protein
MGRLDIGLDAKRCLNQSRPLATQGHRFSGDHVALRAEVDHDLGYSRAKAPRLSRQAQPDQEPMDRGIADEHRRGQPSELLATGPGGSGGQEPAPYTLVLELIRDRDGHLGSVSTGWLQADMADDLLTTTRPPVEHRHEALPVLVIGRAERDGLGVTESLSKRKESRLAALNRKAAIEAFKFQCVC